MFNLDDPIRRFKFLVQELSLGQKSEDQLSAEEKVKQNEASGILSITSRNVRMKEEQTQSRRMVVLSTADPLDTNKQLKSYFEDYVHMFSKTQFLGSRRGNKWEP